MRKNSASGFTLIELMITVVILGILAAIAYPNYTAYIAQTRRTDATIALTRIAAMQEKYFTQCGTYTMNFGDANGVCPPGGTKGLGMVGLAAANPVNTGDVGMGGDNFYSVTIAPPIGGTIAQGFLLTAAPIGVQATRDVARCTTITLTSTGVKGATGSESAGVGGGRCWKK